MNTDQCTYLSAAILLAFAAQRISTSINAITVLLCDLQVEIEAELDSDSHLIGDLSHKLIENEPQLRDAIAALQVSFLLTME